MKFLKTPTLLSAFLLTATAFAAHPKDINDTDRQMCYNVGRFYQTNDVPRPNWQPVLQFAMVQEIGRGSNMYRALFKDSGTFYFESNPETGLLKTLHVLINHRNAQGNVFHCEYDEISLQELKKSYVINKYGVINIITINGKDATEEGGVVQLEMLRNFYSLIRRYNSVGFKIAIDKQGTIRTSRDDREFSFIGFERDGNKGIKKVIFCEDEQCSAKSHITDLDFEL